MILKKSFLTNLLLDHLDRKNSPHSFPIKVLAAALAALSGTAPRSLDPRRVQRALGFIK